MFYLVRHTVTLESIVKMLWEFGSGYSQKKEVPLVPKCKGSQIQLISVKSRHTLLQDINNGDSRAVGGQVVPSTTWVQQPLLYMAVVSACVSRFCSLYSQAVHIRGDVLKLQPWVWAWFLYRTAVSVAEHCIMADGEHTLLVSFLFTLRVGHVPWHGEARVFRGLGRYTASQADWSGLRYCDVRLQLLHLQSDR